MNFKKYTVYSDEQTIATNNTTMTNKPNTPKTKKERLPEVKKTIEVNQVSHLEAKMNKLIEENRTLNANFRQVSTDYNRLKSDYSLKEGQLVSANRTIDRRTSRKNELELHLSDLTVESNKRLRKIKIVALIGFILSLFGFVIGFSL